MITDDERAAMVLNYQDRRRQWVKNYNTVREWAEYWEWRNGYMRPPVPMVVHPQPEPPTEVEVFGEKIRQPVDRTTGT